MLIKHINLYVDYLTSNYLYMIKVLWKQGKCLPSGLVSQFRSTIPKYLTQTTEKPSSLQDKEECCL